MLRRIAVVDIAGDVRKQAAADLIGLPIKNDQIHRHIIFEQKIPDSIHRRPERPVFGPAIDPGRDQRKRDRLTVMGPGQFQRRPVAGSKLFRFPGAAALPLGPHRMDHIFTGQTVSLRNLCAASLAAVKCPAFRQQLRPRRPVDAAVHTAASQQRVVGRVHNGIHLHFCDVVPDNL